jgi:hypothetical protein
MSSDFFDRCLGSLREPPSLNPHNGGGFVYSNVDHSITYDRTEDDKKVRQIDSTKCPMCGGEMSKKVGVYGYFMGCNSFPKCKGSRKIR